MATRLYHTNFSPSQSVLSGLTYDEGPWYNEQNISGVKDSTGVVGIIAPWPAVNGNNSFIQWVPQGGATMSNSIQQVTGPTGSTVYALHLNINSTSATPTYSQSPLEIAGLGSISDVNSGMPNANQAYYSMWLKFPSDLSDQLSNDIGYDNWHTLVEWKTVETSGTSDYRLITYVNRDRNTGELYWEAKADGVGHGPSNPWWRQTNRASTGGVAVPVGVWFKVETFWHRSTTGTGRFWLKINDTVLFDVTQSNGLMGPSHYPINRLFLASTYSGGKNPTHQWITDLEIWDDFPTASPPPDPGITASTTTVLTGSALTAIVTNGPATVNDWVGFYAVGQAWNSPVAFKYMNNTTTAPATGIYNATLNFNAVTSTGLPAPAGQYAFRLYNGATLALEATSEQITVTEPSTTTVLSGCGGASWFW